MKPSNESFSRELRGFGIAGILAIIIILGTGNILLPSMIALPIGGLLVLFWAALSQTPWREIGYAPPKSWLQTVVLGLCMGIGFKFLLKAVVMPAFGAAPVNPYYHFLSGNAALFPAAAWSMLAAGFGEETVFRGFMFERLGKLVRDSPRSRIFIVLFTSAWFGLSHYGSQGLTGVEQATITGLLFGTIYAATRNIWLVMIAHSAFDLTALAMIYWNLETTVAHLLFK